MPRSRHLILVAALALALLALVEAYNAYRFSSHMIHARGVVVDLHRDTYEDDFHYHPIISYKDPSGKEYRHVPGIGGSASAYAIGQRVSIWHEPGEPVEARVTSFYELWGVALFTGAMSLLLLAFLFMRRHPQPPVDDRGLLLRTGGRPLQARLEGVLHNTGVEVNGFSPYQIKARWSDPTEASGNGELVFFSQDLWFDPSEGLEGREWVCVYIDPRTPEHYFMDVSFLFLARE